MIKHGLSEANYFSFENQMKYMGASQFKAFRKCEAGALAEISGAYTRPVTTALLVGSYVDAHFSGTLNVFAAQHPEIFTKSGTLKSDYEHANTVIARIERDEVLMQYLSGEHQVIMVGEIAGVPYKIKIDSYFPGQCIVDQKIMKDFEPMYVEGCGRLNFIEAWGYDIQGAIYQEIVRQNTGDKLPFIIAGATKEKPEPNIGLFEVPQAHLDACLDEVVKFTPMYQRLKSEPSEAARCEKCNYCKHTRVLAGPVDMEDITE